MWRGAKFVVYLDLQDYTVVIIYPRFYICIGTICCEVEFCQGCDFILSDHSTGRYIQYPSVIVRMSYVVNVCSTLLTYSGAIYWCPVGDRDTNF